VWADERCAVSATGTGEFFIRAAFAHQIACMMELAGRSLEDAADRALADVTSLGGTGGCIAVDRQGRVAMPLSTPAMYRGVVDADGTRVAILAEDALRSPE
jgi:beta-aspartyl-peptidase (threonine type)